MDKVERDKILTEPISNPVLLSLKQEGAIIGDGVKSFVDRCFVPGAETYYGSDLHSWYQAYCKAHTLSPLSYQKFIQRLQRVLSKQWRPSEVIWMDGKTKRQSACWEGIRVLPCFLDRALNEDEDDKKPSDRPHIPDWICVKEKCQDGGLTDLTTTLQTLTPEKNAETIDLHTLPTLPTQSLRNAKISHEMNGDRIEENKVSDESGSKVCKARLTPTSECVDDGCKVSKVCKAGDEATPAQPPSKTSPPEASKFKIGDWVQVESDYVTPQLRGQQAMVVEDYGDVRYGIDFGRKIEIPNMKPKRIFHMDKQYFHHVTEGSQLDLPI
jgi:hypothetical protein